MDIYFNISKHLIISIFFSATYSFMGRGIIKEVFKVLIHQHGMLNASVVVFSGSSAGANGVFLNADSVQSLLIEEGSGAKIRSVVDSGWFLERPNMEYDVSI